MNNKYCNVRQPLLHKCCSFKIFVCAVVSSWFMQMNASRGFPCVRFTRPWGNREGNSPRYIELIDDHGISTFLCVCVCVFVLNSEQWYLELFRRGRSHPAWVRNRVNLVPRAFPSKNGWGRPPIFWGKSPGNEVGLGWIRACHTRAAVAFTCFVLFCFLILFIFCKCMFVFFFILACLCPFFSLLFLRMKNSNRQIRRLHAYLTNKSTPCKPTCCIPLHHLRKIRVNCLKEKLMTLVHITVFLKHDQLIQTEGLIENFMHDLNFANYHVESRQCQTLYATYTSSIMHHYGALWEMCKWRIHVQVRSDLGLSDEFLCFGQVYSCVLNFYPTSLRKL